MSNVNVFDGGEVIARVTYNQKLDYWDGNNWQNGGNGRHRGLTRLDTGEYVLIRGTDWEGERDTGEIITPEQALQEILKVNATELFEEPMFQELKQLHEKTIKGEWQDNSGQEENVG